MNAPARSSPFFELAEAMPLPGCFLCRLLDAQTHRWLDHLLYESVNDPQVRIRWRHEHGFCHRHAWRLAQAGDALGIGLLYADLLDNLGPDDVLLRPTGRPCAVCAFERDALIRHLDVLVQHWSDPQLQQAFAQSDGLCGPHLRAALTHVRDSAVRHTLQAHSAAALRRLTARLHTLIESFDYQHAKPTDPAVKNAWRQAIAMLTGDDDVIADR